MTNSSSPRKPRTPNVKNNSLTARRYVAVLRKGLREALGVIEARDLMTPQSDEFEPDVLKPLRDFLKLRLAWCAVCGNNQDYRLLPAARIIKVLP
jgi:hypothetical protein